MCDCTIIFINKYWLGAAALMKSLRLILKCRCPTFIIWTGIILILPDAHSHSFQLYFYSNTISWYNYLLTCLTTFKTEWVSQCKGDLLIVVCIVIKKNNRQSTEVCRINVEMNEWMNGLEQVNWFQVFNSLKRISGYIRP